MVELLRHDPVEAKHGEGIDDHEGEGKDRKCDVTKGALLSQGQESQLMVPVGLHRQQLLFVLCYPRTKLTKHYKPVLLKRLTNNSNSSLHNCSP